MLSLLLLFQFAFVVIRAAASTSNNIVAVVAFSGSRQRLAHHGPTLLSRQSIAAVRRSYPSLCFGYFATRRTDCATAAFACPISAHHYYSRAIMSRPLSSSSISEPPSSDTNSSSTPLQLQFIDIGANLLDERYTEGRYHGTVRHEPDLEVVVERASKAGVTHLILTAGTLRESRRALQQVRTWRQQQHQQLEQTMTPASVSSDDDNSLPSPPRKIQFFCTVGVHPTRCLEFDESGNPEQHLAELLQVARDGISDGSVVAIGELGLDYDRLEFCPRDVQRRYLQSQLQGLAQPTGLPLFLHNRNAGTELHDLLRQFRSSWNAGGVVHSFDDTIELANQFLDLGLFIGLNGCSLRTTDNLNVVQQLPLDRILLETDCPYCEIKATHAGYHHVQTKFQSRPEKKYQRDCLIKGRNEPCAIIQVAEIVAGSHGVPLTQVASTTYANTLQLFGLMADITSLRQP